MPSDIKPALSKNLRFLLETLTEAALNGQTCPTNSDIAGRFCKASVGTAAYMFKRLEKLGFIQVERFQTARQVTICSLNIKTAPTKDTRTHWRIERAQAYRKKLAA